MSAVNGASDGKQLMPDDNRDLCEICWSPLQMLMKKVHEEAREKRNSPGYGDITATMTGEGDRAGPSKPSVLVPNDFCEIFAAGLVVDQADDECPHDRTPLFDRGRYSGALFQDAFVAGGKWFRRRQLFQQPRQMLLSLVFNSLSRSWDAAFM